LANPEEYSFASPAKTSEVPEKSKKVEKVEPLVNWLNPEKTLREQGFGDSDIVILKKKFFFTDQNVDRSDPVQLVLMYNQSREMILSGKHPCSEEEAAQFAALQLQIDHGNHEPDKHKSGFVKLKLLVPPEYQKSKSLEKKIYAEHRKLQGTSDLNAKFRYVQLIRSMKTYGVSFFNVKEKSQKNKKLVSILLGVTKESILRMDLETKSILEEWKLTQLRRWAATPKGFTLDFGDYASEYYNVETTEGEQISRLIAGYIDIIIKKRNQITTLAPQEKAKEDFAVVEDFVNPGKASNITVVSGELNKSRAAQFADPHGQNDNSSKWHKTEDSSIPEFGHNLEVLELQKRALQATKIVIGFLGVCKVDVHASSFLPAMQNDAATKKWRQDAYDINAESIASHVAAILASTAGILMLSSDNQDGLDYESISILVSSFGTSVGQTIQGLRMLNTLTSDESEANTLLNLAKSLIEQSSIFLSNLLPVISGSKNIDKVGISANFVCICCKNLMSAIKKDPITAEKQALITETATDIFGGVNDLVIALKDGSSTSTLKEDSLLRVEQFSAKCLSMAKSLQVITSLLSSQAANPLCLEQIENACDNIQESLNVIFEELFTNDNEPHPIVLNLKADIEDSIEFLLESARGIQNDIDMDIKAEYENIQTAINSLQQNLHVTEEMIPYAKELTICSTKFAEILKKKATKMSADDDRTDLEQLTKELESLTAAMVRVARDIVTVKNDQARKDDLNQVLEDMKDLTTVLAAPFVKSSTANSLLNALQSTMTCSHTLIGASRQAAAYNRDQSSQFALNKAGKLVVSYHPKIVSITKESKLNLQDFANRFKLMKLCEAFYEPVLELISAAKLASSTTVDSASQNQLLNSAQKLAEELVSMQRILGMLGEIMVNEDLSYALQSIKIAQNRVKNAKSEQQTNLPKHELYSSESDLKDSIIKIQSLVKSLDNPSILLNIQKMQDILVQMIDESSNMAEPAAKISSFLGSSDEKEHFYYCIGKLFDAISIVVLRSREAALESGSNVRPLAFTVIGQTSSDLLNCLPSLRAVQSARGAISTLKLNFDSFKSPSSAGVSTLAASPQATVAAKSKLWMAASEVTNAAQKLITYPDSENMSKGAKEMEDKYAKIIEISVGLANQANVSPSELVQIKSSISDLGFRCDDILIELYALIGDTNSLNKLKLAAAVKNIQDSVDKLLNSLSPALASDTVFNEANAVLNNVATEVEKADYPPENNQPYAENVNAISNATKEINMQLTSIKSKLQKPNGEISDDIFKLANQVNQLVHHSVNAAQTLSNNDQDTYSTKKRLTEPYIVMQNAEYLIEQSEAITKTLVDKSLTDEQMTKLAESANMITIELQSLSADEDTYAQYGEQLKKIAAECNMSFNAYIKALSKLKEDNNEVNRDLFKELKVPFVDSLVNANRLCNTIAKSAQSIVQENGYSSHQPLIDSTKLLLSQTKQVVLLGKMVSSTSDDANLRKQLAKEIDHLDQANINLVNSAKESSPGQRECAAALQKLDETFKSIKTAQVDIQKGVNVSNGESKSEELKDQLMALTNLTNVIHQSENVHNFIQIVEELPITYSNVIDFDAGKKLLR
jgi:talin